MKLSRIYASRPDLFVDIDFQDGLNAVVAEIRLPQNKDRYTHNLGKTTLALLLDYCLLKKKTSDFFCFATKIGSRDLRSSLRSKTPLGAS